MKSRRRSPRPTRTTGAPFLHRITSLPDKIDHQVSLQYSRLLSRNRPALRSNVTFFVGENGSGKSTLLEAIAECCGFNPEGGNRDHHRATFADRSPLAQALRLSWQPKVTEGFFMRAESFYNFATYLDSVSNLLAYGENSLHEQSHGESFMALFANRFEQGIYLLDEPEAALSPQRDSRSSRSSTTSRRRAMPNSSSRPIPHLLSYPGAVLFDLDGETIEEIDYRGRSTSSSPVIF